MERRDEYDLEVTPGDSLHLEVELPDFTPRGGPHDLTTGATVTAQIEPYSSDETIPLSVTVLDPVARRVAVRHPANETALLPGAGRWRLRVALGGWAKTYLEGELRKDTS